ncbi:MAG: hypothetical protein MI724_15880 [Spirochaetales bacterium]|nr:hypothetical protein [Spirochaetales bacterium]
MKRSAERGLRKARRFFRTRKFTQVINYLEPQVFMFRESYEYYYVLGMSCLHTGDYAGSFSYLRRALDIDKRVEAMLGLAAVLLRRRQTDMAIRTYLDILDIDHRNRRAKRALQWLRSLEDPEDALDWFENRRFTRILPPLGWYVPLWTTVSVGIAVAGAAIFFLYPVVLRSVEPLFAPEPREGSQLLTPIDVAVPLVVNDVTEEARFVFSDREAERLLEEIGDYFNDGRDNVVRRELNRVALSNATPLVKDRAAAIDAYLAVPDFTDFSDNFTHGEVISDPPLYDGVFVRWRGRIANLSVGEEAILFDLLVGYQTRQVLEGIVPAQLRFAVLLENDQPVELIGRVHARGAEAIALEVTSIRVLSPAEV